MDIQDLTSDFIYWCDVQASILLSNEVPEPVHYMADDFLPTLAKIMVAVPYALRESFQKAAGKALGTGISSGYDLDINLPVLFIALFVFAAILIMVLMPRR